MELIKVIFAVIFVFGVAALLTKLIVKYIEDHEKNGD